MSDRPGGRWPHEGGFAAHRQGAGPGDLRHARPRADESPKHLIKILQYLNIGSVIIQTLRKSCAVETQVFPGKVRSDGQFLTN